MNTTKIASLCRDLDDAELAAIARDMPDELLVAAFGHALSKLGLSSAIVRALPPAKDQKHAAAPPRKERTVSPRRPARAKSEAAPDARFPPLSLIAEKVLAILRGADGEISPADIIERGDFNAAEVRNALMQLQNRKLAKHNGKGAKNSRWSLAL